jgi:hypothetical protein
MILIVMPSPLPGAKRHETPEALKRLLSAERDAQRQPRLPARSFRPHRPAPRLHGARLRGGRRPPVGPWLAASQRRGVPQRLPMATAPGQAPLLSEARREALRPRLAAPGGWARSPASAPWRRLDDGGAMAAKTGPRVGRHPLGANRPGPRHSPSPPPPPAGSGQAPVAPRRQAPRTASQACPPPAAARPVRRCGQEERRGGDGRFTGDACRALGGKPGPWAVAR